ncbi:MAG: hypothetical protein GF401_19905 [Chitinivibrionales bacterium]|nr:hypothetical protein [Chitinivibrionales bacterium]
MSSYQGNERRRVQRRKLVTFSPSTFSINGKEYRALMRDVSELGAGFKLDGPHEGLELEPGSEVAFAVRTPYGESQCKGKIVWSREEDDSYIWGMQFTELSQDEQDPLRSYIISPF